MCDDVEEYCSYVAPSPVEIMLMLLFRWIQPNLSNKTLYIWGLRQKKAWNYTDLPAVNINSTLAGSNLIMHTWQESEWDGLISIYKEESMKKSSCSQYPCSMKLPISALDSLREKLSLPCNYLHGKGPYMHGKAFAVWLRTAKVARQCYWRQRLLCRVTRQCCTVKARFFAVYQTCFI
jgi:hypothetical protein